MFWLKSGRIRLVVVGIVAMIVIGRGNAKADFTFGEPVNLGPVINSSAHEYSHCLSSDGLELYFGSSREGSLGSWDLWVTTRTTTEDAWGEPKNLGQLVNSPRGDHGPTLSSDGLELYFNSSRPGGAGSYDIWVTRRTTKADSWSQPENLGAPVNSAYAEYNPTLSSEGLELYFAFSSEVDLWEPKIAVTRRETINDPWGSPVILGPVVNNWTWQDTPWISSDGLILMFTDYGWDNASPRLGGLGGTDIWFTRRSSYLAEWTTPLNLGNPINSVFNEDFPMISADGSTIYFNSDRPGGFGSQDLWQAPILPVVDFDGDGSVGLNDLMLMVDSWGTNNTRCDIGPMPWGDGVVDAADLDVLMASWDQAVDFPYDPRKASNPEPVDGYVADMEWYAALSWIPGEDAVQHDVYLGTDQSAVADADVLDTSGIYRGRQDANDYMPTEATELGQTFYWRIDQVNADDTTYRGAIWSFTVGQFLSVDDFESYNDYFDPITFAGTTIWNTWIDGWFNGTGSLVGYLMTPFAEVDIIHGGYQSLPFFYDNDGTAFEDTDHERTGVAYYSETQRTWAEPQDWTRKGTEILTLWLYGEPDNTADPFYVGLEDSAGNRKDITHPDPAVLTVNDWRQWRIPLADLANVDLTAIKIMYIGTGEPTGNQPGGSGLVRIDDIELHLSSAPSATIEPMAHWTLDEVEGELAHDSTGTYDATLVGHPIWQPTGGMVDGALECDGIGDYVETPFVISPADGSLSVFAWIKGGAVNQVIFSQKWGLNWLMVDLEGNLASAFIDAHHFLVSQIGIVDGQWHHVGLVWDAESVTRSLIVDGVEVARDTPTIFTPPGHWEHRIGASWGLHSNCFWSGLIDDVRIYQGALSAEDVAYLAQ